MRVLLFCYACFLVMGCNRKLFPTAHISGIDIVQDTLYYYYEYTEWDESDEMKINAGWKYGLGLRAMTDIDGILKSQIKSYGFDTAVSLAAKDRVVVDSMWNRFLRNQNDSAFLLAPVLSNHLQIGSNILKIRLRVVLPGTATSGLGFYNDGLILGSYFGLLFSVNNGSINDLNTVQAYSHVFMRNYLFTPKRARNFLDRILK